MLLSQIDYWGARFTSEKVYCPRDVAGDDQGSRGAKANTDCIVEHPEEYIDPSQCGDCEYKMYRMMGTTCPAEPPAWRMDRTKEELTNKI